MTSTAKIPRQTIAVKEQREIVLGESSKQSQRQLTDREAQTDEAIEALLHAKLPLIAILMYNLQTPCINYEQPGVVNIKHVLCVSSGSPQSMPCMTLVRANLCSVNFAKC